MVVPEGTRVILFTGSWHQTLSNLCLLAPLFGGVYPFSWVVVSQTLMTYYSKLGLTGNEVVAVAKPLTAPRFAHAPLPTRGEEGRRIRIGVWGHPTPGRGAPRHPLFADFE
jgi:hypothetical protein